MAIVADGRALGYMAELSAAIEFEMARPFVWGESDCCLAICNVLHQTGHGDPAAGYRGRYSDESGARVVMAGTTEAVAQREAERLGWPEIGPNGATDGDIGIVGRSLAIFCSGWWWAKSREGCVLQRRASRAWRPA